MIQFGVGGFLAFVAFTWVFVACVAFHFASSAFVWVHAAFAPLAFRILCFPIFFGLGFLNPQHRQFLSGAPPPPPFRLKCTLKKTHS